MLGLCQPTVKRRVRERTGTLAWSCGPKHPATGLEFCSLRKAPIKRGVAQNARLKRMRTLAILISALCLGTVHANAARARVGNVAGAFATAARPEDVDDALFAQWVKGRDRTGGEQERRGGLSLDQPNSAQPRGAPLRREQDSRGASSAHWVQINRWPSAACWCGVAGR